MNTALLTPSAPPTASKHRASKPSRLKPSFRPSGPAGNPPRLDPIWIQPPPICDPTWTPPGPRSMARSPP